MGQSDDTRLLRRSGSLRGMRSLSTFVELIPPIYCLMNHFPVQCCLCVFQIDCQVENCTLRYIDGSAAESLSVYCGGSHCIGSHIVCPAGTDSNCSVNCTVGSCHSAVIGNAAGGSMNTLSVVCYDCEYMTISLDPDAISAVDILCESSKAVRAISFEFYVQFNHHQVSS